MKTKDTDLSLATLELCDWLIDNMTLSAQAEDFEEWATKIIAAKREIRAAVEAAGGVTVAAKRQG